MSNFEDDSVETTGRPRILLVEPDPSVLANRLLLLKRSGFMVAPAGNSRDVYYLRCFAQVNLAVVSDTLGLLELRDVADCVRHQWPSAHILILGVVPNWLEDYLYDEALDIRFQPEQLIDSIYRLCRISQRRGIWSHMHT
jgi:hypothetical protein